jgi:hypothetical protein
MSRIKGIIGMVLDFWTSIGVCDRQSSERGEQTSKGGIGTKDNNLGNYQR